MTSPPLVETAEPSSFKIFSSVSWAARLAVAPEAFGLRGCQRPFGYLGSKLMQSPGGWAGEGREPRRERLFQFGLHVHVGEELIREVVGELGLDLFVLKKLVAGAAPSCRC